MPVGAVPSAEDNLALARILAAYVRDTGPDRTSLIEGLLEAHAAFPWRASLLLNLGIVDVRSGRPTRALRAFEEAWMLSKGAQDSWGRAVADMAIAQRAQILSRVGKVRELRALLEELGGREVGGTASELLLQARGAAQLMATQSDTTLRCGPLALDLYLGHGRPGYRTDAKLAAYHASHWGTSLEELGRLSQELGTGLRMAKRVDASAPLVVPSVVHWELEHFTALVAEQDGRFLLKDPVFGSEVWVSRKALDEELSGYALVDVGRLPVGWRSVPAEEGSQVWGRGTVGGQDPSARRRRITTARSAHLEAGPTPGWPGTRFIRCWSA